MSERKVSARLQTRCGCTQFRLVPAPAPQFLEIPIGVTMAQGDGDGGPITRRFELRRLSPPEIAVEAEYAEVPDLP